MAMREQERRPPPETARTASDEPLPQLFGLLGPSATMATGNDMAGDGAIGEKERGPEGVALALLSGVSSPFASPQIQRRPRSHIPRAAPSHPWGFKLPVLPPAPANKKPAKKAKKTAAKKRGRRNLLTGRQGVLCNVCGIRLGAPGAVLPEQAHLRPPPTATTTVVPEHKQPPPQEIQPASESPPPDSPILASMPDLDVYLLKRTSPRRDNAPAPPTTAESAPGAAAPAPGNKEDKQMKCCLHCATTESPRWRTGPAGESTLCNACGVRYRQGRLLPEYRPAASPTFNQSQHSNKHSEVLQIREMQDHPAPPAAFQPCSCRNRKLRKGKVQQHLPRPPPPAVLHAGDDMVQQHLPTPPPALLPHAGDDMEMEQHLLPPPPPELPHAADEMEQHLPPPPALPHAGDELMMGDPPIPPPDMFLFDEPAAPRIIDDDTPVIVIDDD